MLYLINRPHKNETTIRLLRQAADDRGIELTILDPDEQLIHHKPLPDGSLLYKVSADRGSSTLFSLLVHDGVATIFKNAQLAVMAKSGSLNGEILRSKANLPVIPATFGLPQDTAQLAACVEHLGGFPVVIKAAGGSHGVGVMRLDSFASLTSVVDFLLSHHSGEAFILRKYIDYVAHARLIVLGDKVIDSIEYDRVSGDFRSNVGKELRVRPKKFSEAIERAAVAATRVSGAEFGGVDILIDESGDGYIAEVNTPCFFPRAQMVSGVDIAGQLVDYLAGKARHRER